METVPEKCAKSRFPSNMYNIMTINLVKCMNGILENARSFFICVLLESIMFIIQDWFYK